MMRAANRSLPDEWVLPRSWSKKTPGAPVHLGDDDALGAVDDEGAVVGHERDVAHVDFLLLHVADGLCAGLFVDFKDREAQRHFQRRGVGHVALLAFFDVEFRLFEFVGDEFKDGGLGEIHDREDRLEDRFNALR